jgi:hypothetical protein
VSHRSGYSTIATFLTLVALHVLAAGPRADPFAFFHPTVTITADDRRQLDRGQAVARVLPGTDLEVAIWAAVPVNIDGDRLVPWIRRIEELKKSAYVLAIRRFSDPPRDEDVADLALDDEDLSEILTCQPGRCGLKLSAAEITALHRVAADAGTERNVRLQQRFRQIVLERAKAYLNGGHAAPYENHAGQVSPVRELAALVDHSVFLAEHAPEFAAYLRGASTPSIQGVESFLYWSKERLGNMPIVAITSVSIFRDHGSGLPEVLVAGKEIFATHYVNASLGLTVLVRGEAGASNYLVYVNRSEVDILGGAFGGIIRWYVQRRLKAEAASVLGGLRRRLENGEAPAAKVSGLRIDNIVAQERRWAWYGAAP